VRFSPPKTESLIIYNKTNLAEHPPIHVHGSALNEVSYHKHLGIILSKDLSWHKHISSIEFKTTSLLNRMTRFKYILDRRSLERIYICNIRPLMEYRDAIWAGGDQPDLDRLEMVQKDAARVVTGATARCSTVLLMKDVTWALLQSTRRSHRLTLFYKIVNGLSPPYLSELLPTRVADRMRYALRTSQDFIMPVCRTNAFNSSFLPNIVMEYNGLDQDIRNEISRSRLKNKCRVHRERANSLYYYGPRFLNVQIARLRIGCSNLHSHLCCNLHVEESASCKCGYADEDCEHYFFCCEAYAAQRLQLFRVIDQAILSIQTILHSDANISLEDNIKILDAIHQYIIDMGRFRLQNS